MNFEVGSLLIFVVFYLILMIKNKYSPLIIFLFLLVISSKLFFIYLEITNLYVNHFTIRDESTFIQSVIQLNSNNKISFIFISPGDNFLFYILNIFYNIFNSNLSIKLTPIIFSIIAFHYSYKLTKRFKLNDTYAFFTIFLIFFWPSNFLFNYSATKEILQTTFLIILVYYSLTLLEKINISIILKYFFFLLLFSYSHRGFEMIAVVYTLILLLMIILNKINIDFDNIINVVIGSFVTIVITIAFLIYFRSFDILIQNLISPDFINWYNNMRVSNEISPNTYKIKIESLSFQSMITLSIKVIYYYFFYLPNISNYFYVYYFFEIILTCCFILIISLTFLFGKYFKSKFPHFDYHKILLLIILYFIINIGFAFFNTNIGNAIRHKTVSSFIIFLIFSFFYGLIYDLIFKLSIKKLYNNYNQRR